jgi:hypothetical protein
MLRGSLLALQPLHGVDWVIMSARAAAGGPDTGSVAILSSHQAQAFTQRARSGAQSAPRRFLFPQNPNTPLVAGEYRRCGSLVPRLADIRA